MGVVYDRGGVFQQTRKKQRDGTNLPLTKDMQQHSIIWELCTEREKFQQTIKKKYMVQTCC